MVMNALVLQKFFFFWRTEMRNEFLFLCTKKGMSFFYKLWNEGLEQVPIEIQLGNIDRSRKRHNSRFF